MKLKNFRTYLLYINNNGKRNISGIMNGKPKPFIVIVTINGENITPPIISQPKLFNPNVENSFIFYEYISIYLIKHYIV
jgi:hypothetical protein